MSADTPTAKRWADAWPDALAFVLGLAMAWWFRWNTTDLVWSLWLSSLVVGYALIVWILSEPLRELIGSIAVDHSETSSAAGKGFAIALYGVGTLFGLVFFSVHFGGFHFVHSVFLSAFFPVVPVAKHAFIDPHTYAEVFKRYWWFLPAAFLAERQAFRRSYRKAEADDTSVTAEAIARRKAKGDKMMEPYKNVVRMHLLIFFFFAAHFAHLESFLVYAVVYVVYFFPWRLLRAEKVPLAAT